MATLSPSVTIHDPRTGRRGRGGDPPTTHGGGDGNGGNESPDFFRRLRRARVGFFILAVWVSMLFISFTSAYVVRKDLPSLNQITNQMGKDWIPVDLPVSMLVVNTILLLGSSLTIELARRKVAQQMALAPVGAIPGITIGREKTNLWLGITAALGVAFIVGQWLVWQELKNRGFYVSSNPSSSFLYVLTATHAIHLMGGIFALIYAISASLLHKTVESRRIVIEIASWYWHFMAALWIYVFALLAFVR
ncbi:MAG TPA: cytochrome c oxidase subunit 3 [Terriglobales bacterium]|nr:cytochrome c oxidase subunit 3 [Terriglobales bacterium]